MRYPQQQGKTKTATFLLLGTSALIILISAQSALGQACSCGGAPLMGSLEFPTTNNGAWRIGLTYEFHEIADVVSGSTELNDNTRQRNVHSGLLDISYGITDRISASAIFTVLQQERETNSAEGTGEFLRTRGVGDGVVMMKSDLVPFSLKSFRQLAIGAGIKIPFGKTSLTANGSLLAADMQPGTGSWDGVLWGYAYQGFQPIAPIGIQANATYRMNTENDRFGGSNQGYKFGNEFIANLNVHYSPIPLFNYSLGMRYRSVAADRFAGLELPNSGGSWFDLVPGINVNINNSWGVRGGARIPVSRALDGIQLTTNYALTFAVFRTFAATPSIIGLDR